MVEGVPNIIFAKGICQGCMTGKHQEQKFEKGKAKRASSPLHLIHKDISRPLPHLSLNTSRYILTFIDDYSIYSWVYFLKLKSKVFEYFMFSKVVIENFTRSEIKVLRTENGGEHVKNKFQ